MFSALIRVSLNRRGLTLLLAALLVLWGGFEASRLPVDVFPDLNRPTVTVLTEAGARSPEEVELWVTTPIEQAVAGAPGVERVRSQSAAGLSVVWVELGWGEDLWRGRQQVTERLDAAADGGDLAHAGDGEQARAHGPVGQGAQRWALHHAVFAGEADQQDLAHHRRDRAQGGREPFRQGPAAASSASRCWSPQSSSPPVGSPYKTW